MGKLTVFTSVSILTKKFWADGRKEGSPPFAQGTFEVRDISNHEDLKELILSLNHKQALSHSTPFGYTKLIVSNVVIQMATNLVMDSRFIIYPFSLARNI